MIVLTMLYACALEHVLCCGAQLLVAAAHLSFCLVCRGQGQDWVTLRTSLLPWGSYVQSVRNGS